MNLPPEITEILETVATITMTPGKGFEIVTRRPEPEIVASIRAQSFNVRAAGGDMIWIGRGKGTFDDSTP